MIKDNVERIREKVEKASISSGFGQHIEIVAVTKSHTAAEAQEVCDAGLRQFGENRVQEFLEKYPEFIGSDVKWHIIGTLQKNKVKPLMGKASLIQSIDSIGLAEAINSRALAEGITQEALIQFNAAQEAQKHGFSEGELKGALERLSQLPNITISGIMMIAPDTADGRMLDYIFSYTRVIFEKMAHYSSSNLNIDLRILSMGMSNDFERAIQCGSNMVRIGRALFSNGG